MNRRTWKKFESKCAWFINGKRYPANTGERVDVESKETVAQAKYKKALSHNELAALSDEMEVLGLSINKLGLVLHQVPPGRGKRTVEMVTMTWAMFDQYFCLRKE